VWRAFKHNLRERNDTGALRDSFLRTLQPQWLPGPQTRGQSVLRDLPADRPAEPPLPVFTSGLPWSGDAATPAIGERGHFDHLTLVDTHDLDLLDEPERLRPLNADTIAAALVTMGFRPAREPQRTHVDLAAESDGDLWVRDQADAEAEVSIELVAGAIRTVNVEPTKMNPGDAAQLINDFTQLAKTLGARIVTDDD
jgi:hypothetical protein